MTASEVNSNTPTSNTTQESKGSIGQPSQASELENPQVTSNNETTGPSRGELKFSIERLLAQGHSKEVGNYSNQDAGNVIHRSQSGSTNRMHENSPKPTNLLSSIIDIRLSPHQITTSVNHSSPSTLNGPFDHAERPLDLSNPRKNRPLNDSANSSSIDVTEQHNMQFAQLSIQPMSLQNALEEIAHKRVLLYQQLASHTVTMAPRPNTLGPPSFHENASTHRRALLLETSSQQTAVCTDAMERNLKPYSINEPAQKNTDTVKKARNRTAFTREEKNYLINAFEENFYPDAGRFAELARVTNHTENQIKVWHQNWRSKKRKERCFKKAPGRPSASDKKSYWGVPMTPEEIEQRNSKIAIKKAKGRGGGGDGGGGSSVHSEEPQQ
nr:homeobox protein unc 4 [Hymenolepis microstoma]